MTHQPPIPSSIEKMKALLVDVASHDPKHIVAKMYAWNTAVERCIEITMGDASARKDEDALYKEDAIPSSPAKCTCNKPEKETLHLPICELASCEISDADTVYVACAVPECGLLGLKKISKSKPVSVSLERCARALNDWNCGHLTEEAQKAYWVRDKHQCESKAKAVLEAAGVPYGE